MRKKYLCLLMTLMLLVLTALLTGCGISTLKREPSEQEESASTAQTVPAEDLFPEVDFDKAVSILEVTTTEHPTTNQPETTTQAPTDPEPETQPGHVHVFTANIIEPDCILGGYAELLEFIDSKAVKL